MRVRPRGHAHLTGGSGAIARLMAQICATRISLMVTARDVEQACGLARAHASDDFVNAMVSS